MENKTFSPFPFLVLGLAFIPLVGNFLLLQSNCFHAIDFSIYQEAIYKLSQFEDLNPFITIRNVNIFNDHFDPIIFIAAIWVKLFSLSPYSLLTFEWFFSLLLPLTIILKFIPSNNEKIIVMLFLLLSKGLLQALYFPIHPTTWAFTFFFLSYPILKKEKNLILWAVALPLFKEVFSFSLLGLSLFFFIQKKLHKGLALGVVGCLYLMFHFLGRPALFDGEFINYGHQFLSPLLHSPITFLQEVLTRFDYFAFLKLTYPLLFLVGLGLKLKNNYLFKVLSLAIPYIGIHFLTNRFSFHYGAPLAGMILSLLWDPQIRLWLVRLSKKKIIFLGIFLFLNSSSTYTRYFKAFAGINNKCLMSEEKSLSTKKIKRILSGLPDRRKIIATGGVLPSVLNLQHDYFVLGRFSPLGKKYDLLLIEKGQSGDIYPYRPYQIEQVLSRCRYSVSQTLLEDSFYSLWQGPFNESCLKQKDIRNEK